jgi:ribonucleoside-diphosphate reductase alpha chain
MLKMINNTVPRALKRLGYDVKQSQEIVEYIEENDTIEGAPHIKDGRSGRCSIAPSKRRRAAGRFITWGHVKMMGAVQPFISGAISKNINMPTDATVEEIMHAYMESWKLGLKAIAVYRDGPNVTQPLNTSKDKEEKKATLAESKDARVLRRKLPDERRSITHKFDIAGHEGYIIAGMYEDGQPGEIFITMSKEGSTISGLMDSFATAISIALQYGVPLQGLVDKFSHMRFEPSGFTKNPTFRWRSRSWIISSVGSPVNFSTATRSKKPAS